LHLKLTFKEKQFLAARTPNNSANFCKFHGRRIEGCLWMMNWDEYERKRF
jgi:hypothetical protein